MLSTALIDNNFAAKWTFPGNLGIKSLFSLTFRYIRPSELKDLSCDNPSIFVFSAELETRLRLEKAMALKQVDNRIIALKRDINKLKDILVEYGTYEVGTKTSYLIQ